MIRRACKRALCNALSEKTAADKEELARRCNHHWHHNLIGIFTAGCQGGIEELF